MRNGIKGRNGTTYRLDIDNFAIITSYDNNSDGHPRYFTVETKSGETHYYGDAYNAYSAYRGTDGYLTKQSNSNIAKMWMLKAIEMVICLKSKYGHHQTLKLGYHPYE